MSFYNPTMWVMKITPSERLGDTKKIFETLFVKKGCKNLIGYTKEGGKIESFKDRWQRMKVGDLVVVLEGHDRAFGVVEITSRPWDAELTNEDEDWFIHRRRARLVKYFNPHIITVARTNRDTIVEYSGDGAVRICNEIWSLIKDEYKQSNLRQSMQEKLAILEYKKQIILQGPPGTGKTRLAKEIAVNLLGLSEVNDLQESAQFTIIQFHPSYSYEDFVRGIVAQSKGALIEYKNVNKILGMFAKEALVNYQLSRTDNTRLRNYVLVIDEINRANLSSVLGELIYALEYRGEKVESMYAVDGSTALVLPENLYIIGTMNTADRSVGHIDYAIRRRFAFVDVPPSGAVLDVAVPEEVSDRAKALFGKVAALFTDENLTDFKPGDVQLGHSYFIAENEENLKMKLTYEIKPLLREYVRDGILKATVRIAAADHDTKQYIEDLSL